MYIPLHLNQGSHFWGDFQKKLPAKWNNRSKHKSSSGTLSEVCSKAPANPAARPKYCTLWVLLDNSIRQLQREFIRPRQKTLNRSVAGLSKAWANPEHSKRVYFNDITTKDTMIQSNNNHDLRSTSSSPCGELLCGGPGVLWSLNGIWLVPSTTM